MPATPISRPNTNPSDAAMLMMLFTIDTTMGVVVSCMPVSQPCNEKMLMAAGAAQMRA